MTEQTNATTKTTPDILIPGEKTVYHCFYAHSLVRTFRCPDRARTFVSNEIIKGLSGEWKIEKDTFTVVSGSC